MPLSLNGTTLITGSQIGTGAIGTDNIAGSAITAAKLSSGNVVTFSTAATTNQVSLGSSVDVWYDAITITLVPKRNNSIIYVYSLLTVDRGTGNYPGIGTRIHAYKNGVSQGIINELQYSEYEANNQEHHIGRSPINGWHTAPTAGETWTYYIQARNMTGSVASGTYQGYLNRYGGSTAIAMEISA